MPADTVIFNTEYKSGEDISAHFYYCVLTIKR